ncbi:hypothetical protein STRIP9103_02867 [Streptomyces ipomoeae 91-03]|uniref:Uncharacterized protein n=1 Tax=Streptomyces ipomoeae 91-03 TaxID=698759 RepID=L1KZ69_9ACTN|nr:hypothetical protein STRIP9103_02867 [Streptomyces ipomoeae 91-03]
MPPSGSGSDGHVFSSRRGAQRVLCRGSHARKSAGQYHWTGTVPTAPTPTCANSPQRQGRHPNRQNGGNLSDTRRLHRAGFPGRAAFALPRTTPDDLASAVRRAVPCRPGSLRCTAVEHGPAGPGAGDETGPVQHAQVVRHRGGAEEATCRQLRGGGRSRKRGEQPGAGGAEQPGHLGGGGRRSDGLGDGRITHGIGRHGRPPSAPRRIHGHARPRSHQ